LLYNRFMNKKTTLNKRVKTNKPLIVLLAVSASFFFIFSGWLWWTRLYQNPERVFHTMLANSLSTSSITRQVSQAADGNSLDQLIRLDLGTQNRSRIVSTLEQSAGSSQTSVSTESIGTTDQDYSRYTRIQTNQKDADGETLDFSGVLNIWGESSPANSAGAGQARYLNEALLGIVPFGNLSSSERESLLTYINDNQIFKTDYNAVARTTQDGRSVYVYNVTIEPGSYIVMLQEFTKALGVDPVSGLDQQSYADAPQLQIAMSVDTLSQQLVKIVYAGGGRQESYSGHGLTEPIVLPEQTIPLDKLQSRLQAIN